ncbi:MAG: hypothetical protein GX763_09915 [Clostridiaceae bacterium]|nr:hypothetical protein [Clostridiaceae bacterium]
MLTRDEINKSRQRVNYIQHYSTRIPWKDNDFTGRVDDHPKYNVAAQVIPNIASSRNIDFEEANKTKLYAEVNPLNVQHWISENAAFMSNTTLIIKMKHPYNYDDKFKHFKETNFELNPYSFLLRPFSWTQIELVNKKHEFYNFYFDLEKSKQMCAGSGDWLSHGKSQKGVFDYFFSGIEPHKSLIFPYYKQIPFIEDNRRVIAGIGNITSRVELKEYASDGSSNEKNYIWETNVAHSIRDCGEEGFLMPYQEIAEYVKENPDFDASTVTVYEAEGFRTDFSYAAEWVSYDAAIDVLNQTKIALNNIADLRLEKANNEWVNIRLRYVNRQLKEVWCVWQNRKQPARKLRNQPVGK